MNIWDNDQDFEVQTIESAEGDSVRGYTIKRSDGFCFFVQPDTPIEPRAGMSARFYPKQTFTFKRGLFINGHCVFYRTEEEDKVFRTQEKYGKGASEWLRRWDANEGVWSIEMGGLGPGYEQVIHIAAAEMLRALFTITANGEVNIDEQLPAVNKQVDDMVHPILSNLGMSGWQFGAAKNLAFTIFRRWPECMEDEKVKDRHIQVNKSFPQLATT